MNNDHMEFSDFLNEIRDKIPDYLMQYEIESINISPVSKNNGKTYTGLAIILKGEKLAPNIYMEYYYMLYCHEKDMDHILRLVADEYKEAYESMDKSQFLLMDEDECMLKNNIFLKLVNLEKNRNQIEDCPYIEFMDLAITFRVMVHRDVKGIASAALKYSDVERWKLDIEELYDIAHKNTLRMFPPVVKRLDAVLEEKISDTKEIPKNSDLYILTNADGVNGATCILFDDILREFGEKHGGFYILPSSIHETLLLPAHGLEDRGELEEMVRDINRYVVSDMDYLSDTVYYYNPDRQKIEM
ncbi:MAG: hypothetical protein K2G45_11765 [Lachnospiraceae bacterium]|nr:hypothetical protein [Lachnospiraceae bacterium]